MKPFLLEFLNMGGMEIAILMMFVLPFFLTLYCILDIVRSKFKDQNSKLLFLILVVVAPVVGSLAYMLLRRNYKLPSDNDYKMPY